MECREVRQLADAFLSEQLLVETTQAVVAHLERCPTCRDEVDGMRRLRAATRSAFESTPDLRPSPEFAAAVASRVRAQAARQHTVGSPWRAWMAIAAGVLLVIGTGWGWREWSAARLSSLLHAAAGDHQFCALTFRLAERPISLEEAARRYGGVYASLETIEPSTTTLSGGPLRILERHSCVFAGRRFAHIVLRYKRQTVSLLVTEDARAFSLMGTATTSALPVTDGFEVASFRGPRHVAFVISSLARDDLQEVAQALLEPVSKAMAAA